LRQVLRILALRLQTRFSVNGSTLYDFTQTEINDFKIRIHILLLEEKVFRFKISVSNILAVAIVQRLEDLFENQGSFLFAEEFFFDDFVE
jgi:hypothetical protein